MARVCLEDLMDVMFSHVKTVDGIDFVIVFDLCDLIRKLRNNLKNSVQYSSN